MSDLVAAGHLPQGNVVLIKEMATRNGISSTLEEPNVIEGWVDKEKGMK